MIHFICDSIGEFIMIKINLKEIMDDYDINISELSDSTGIARSTITPIVNAPNDVKAISIDTIDTLCDFFGIDISDLITFTPRENKYKEYMTLYKDNLNQEYIDMTKKIGNKKRHIFIFISADNVGPDTENIYTVNITALSKNEYKKIKPSLKKSPELKEVMDGKTFFNDFKKQKRDVQTATTKILLENFVSTKQDFKKIKNGYFNCMWRNNEPLSIQSQFNFGFEYDNGNLIYQN